MRTLSRHTQRYGLHALAWLLLIGAAGCASPEKRSELPLQSAPPFSETGDAAPAERWWTAFDDIALNAQVDRALEDSFTLSAAWERLRAAKAVAEREASELWPDLDGVGDVTFEDGGDDDEQTQLRLGLEASYEIDLWGRIESRVQAERFRASATRADYQAAALSLTAEVARTWYQLAEAALQLALIERQIETNRTVLELLESRFAAGQVRSADVLRQRQLLEQTREQAIAARSRREVLEHQLAILQGRPPQAQARTGDPTLPALPPRPATGLPGDLVQRRPDVRQAYRLLRAADEDLAAAISNQYPRLNLTASISTAYEHPEDMFREWLASIAGQFVAPLFDAGQRSAEVERTAAVTRQRLAEYGQAVVRAFGEVEDALARERNQLDRIDSLDRQLALARQTYQQLRTQYLNGVTDYIAVLDALREEQRLQRALLAARLDAVEFRIALYRALAGCFETPRERQTTGESEDSNAHE